MRALLLCVVIAMTALVLRRRTERKQKKNKNETSLLDRRQIGRTVKLKKKKTGFILLSRHPAAAGCDVTIYTAHPRSLLLVDILTLSSAAGEETGSHDVFQTALADE